MFYLTVNVRAEDEDYTTFEIRNMCNFIHLVNGPGFKFSMARNHEIFRDVQYIRLGWQTIFANYRKVCVRECKTLNNIIFIFMIEKNNLVS